MKKVFSFLAVLALVAMASSAVWAEANLPAAQEAFVSFTATGTLEVSVNLYALPDTYSGDFSYETNPGTPVEKIGFDIGNTFEYGSANTYDSYGNVFAKIHTNLSGMPANEELFMYTRNQSNTAAKYKVTANGNRQQDWGDKTAILYNGLVRGDGKATKEDKTGCNPGDYAPIKMYFCKVTDADKTDFQFSKAKLPPIFGQNQYGTKDLLDFNDTLGGDSVVDIHYTTIGITGADGGIWVGNGEYSTDYANSEDVIIFFGARFDHVVAGDTYSTTTITFAYSAE